MRREIRLHQPPEGDDRARHHQDQAPMRKHRILRKNQQYQASQEAQGTPGKREGKSGAAAAIRHGDGL